MFIINFFKKIGIGLKNLFFGLPKRLIPRKSVRWVFSFILWVIVLTYLISGIVFAVKVYKTHSESSLTKFAVKIYPFPAATVNGNLVWAKDYYQQLIYIRQFSLKTKQPFPEPQALRKQIVDQLIENKVLQTQSYKYQVRVTNKEVDDAYQKIVDQSGGTTEVKKVLNELYGMTEKEFKTLVRQQVLKEKIQNEVITQVKVSHILIKDENKAKEVLDKVNKGEDFAALAKQFSEDSNSKDKGGELGWLSKGQLVINNSAIPEFDEAAFKAKKGEIVGLVKTSVGFEIIKVEDKKGKVTENFNFWLAGLKKQAKIWRFIK